MNISLTKMSFLLMTSCYEYLDSVGKVKCFLGGVKETGNDNRHAVSLHQWMKKTCLHKPIAIMCKGQLQNILANNSRMCHQIFLYLYPHSQAVWAFLPPCGLRTTLFLCWYLQSVYQDPEYGGGSNKCGHFTSITFALNLCCMQLGLQMQLNVSQQHLTNGHASWDSSP